MFKWVALLVLALCSCPLTAAAGAFGSSEAEALLSRANELRSALLAADYGRMVDRLHPKFVAVMGGKETVAADNRKAWEGIKADGFTIDTFSVSAPPEAWEATDDLVTFVPTTMVLAGHADEVTTTSFLVASRRLGGGSWFFIEGSAIKSVEMLAVLFPGLPDGLKLPVISSKTVARVPDGAATGDASTLEPEYVGVPSRLARSGANAVLVPLERQSFTMRTKSKLFSWRGGAQMTYDIPGGSSPVRFGSGEKLEFVVRMASRSVDPSTRFRLVQLKLGKAGKKDRKAGKGAMRQVVALKAEGAFGGAVMDTTMGGQVLLTRPHVGSSFVMVPDGQLAPGEYALVNVGASTAFCFGID